jgi:hypothetical protein
MSAESETEPEKPEATRIWTNEHTSFALALHTHCDRLPTKELQRSAQKLVGKTSIHHKEVATTAQMIAATAQHSPDDELLQQLETESTRLEFETARPQTKSQLKVAGVAIFPHHAGLFEPAAPPPAALPATPTPVPKKQKLGIRKAPIKANGSINGVRVAAPGKAAKTHFKTKQETRDRAIYLANHLSKYISQLKKPIQ